MYIYKYFFVKPTSTFLYENIDTYFTDRCNTYQAAEADSADFIIGSLFNAREMEQKMIFSDHTRDSHGMTQSVLNIGSSGSGSNLTEVNNSLALLSSKMDALEALNLESVIQALHDEDARIVDLIQTNTIGLEVLTELVSNLQSEINTNNTKITNNSTLIGLANTKLTQLDTNLTTNTSSIEALNALIATLQASLVEANTEIVGLSVRIDDLEALGFGSEVAQYTDDVVADASSTSNVVVEPDTNQVNYV